jgi:hypothetical protein
MSRGFWNKFSNYLDLKSYPQKRKLCALLIAGMDLHQPSSCVVECVPNNINKTKNEGITDYGQRSTIKRNTLQLRICR